MFKTSKKYWLIIIVAIALIAGSVERSMATPIEISNWNFDETINNIELPNGKSSSIGSVKGWVGTGQYGTWNPSSAAFNNSTVFDESTAGNVAWINGYSTSPASISQDLTGLNPELGYLNAGHLYTLTVDVGYQKNCTQCTSWDYTIELLAGGTPFISIEGTGTAGNWEQVTRQRLASQDDPLLGGNLEIKLVSYGMRSHFNNVNLTNCELGAPDCDNNNGTTAVPEPATLLLLGSGLLGVALFGKKKFKV